MLGLTERYILAILPSGSIIKVFLLEDLKLMKLLSESYALDTLPRTIWPLFLGILFIGLGNGLQGTLSSWRADYEGFSVLTTGLVMSGYFVGAFVSLVHHPKR